MLLYFIVFFPMLMSFLCYFLGKKKESYRNIIACSTGIIELIVSICLALFNNFQVHMPIMNGINLELDGFRKVYILVIAFMWAMTLLLSPQYFHHHHNLDRYFFFNLMTLGATMGVFVASDLYTAFVFFEIMSFTSFTWVIQEETPGAIKAALTYLAVAVIGGLVALFGLFMIQFKLGTTEISLLYELAEECEDKISLYIAGGCILFGFGAKAGMFPLHIWLPKAHPVAPAPASALLSGVLTKSGIWGILAISCNIFREDPNWGALILTLGTITMVLGAVLALFSIDLKRTLACSSMSQIGFILVGVGMMCLLGEENALAARGTILHMLNHSMFKLVLFESAGIVFMNLHELNLNKIRGFGRGKPVLNIAFLLGALGIGGIPLLNGYVSKTLLHESIVEGHHIYGNILTLVEWLFLFSGGLTLAYMTKLYVCLFVEKNKERQKEFDEKKNYMNKQSMTALCIPALVLPTLGLGANFFMNKIADIGTDFLHAGELEHAVHYLSLENLKGAFISILIAVFMYLVVVRKLLMKNNEYINAWPKKLDLEELIYRPILLVILPTIFGTISKFVSFFSDFDENPMYKLYLKIVSYITKFVCFFSDFDENPMYRWILRCFSIIARTACDLIDAFILAIKKLVFKPSAIPNEDKVTSSISYKLGHDFDALAIHYGKEKEGGKKYAHILYRTIATLKKTTEKIVGNLSFALLMLCFAICVIFVYMFFK